MDPALRPPHSATASPTLLPMSREWGPWTVIKLNTIEGYLSGFTTASQRKAGRTLYLDLFGGRPSNRRRGSDEDYFAGSALRAANTRPEFTHLIVTELSRSAAAEQREALQQAAPGRAEVIQGDCNEVMPQALERLVRKDSGWRHAPTFALIDQYSAQVRWETLQTLARFKDPIRTKIELFMFFGPSFILRGLHGVGNVVNAAHARHLDDMFGDRAWRYIVAAWQDDVLSWTEAEQELVNLMRWLLEQRLGYKMTLPLKLSNTVGRHIFSMIYASDHEVGSKIMTSLFGGAQDAVDEMVRLHRLERSQAKSIDTWLFEPADLAAGGRGVGKRSPLGPPRAPFTYDRLWDRDK